VLNSIFYYPTTHDMTSSPAQFRFRDLPREIRNKVYRELLCDFKPRPTTVDVATDDVATVDVATMLNFARAHHDVDTTILRTNTAIYREAYDVMIRTNRFVKLNFISNLPLLTTLNGLQVPTVAWEKKTVESFKGYVLSLDLSCTKPFHGSLVASASDLRAPCALMILHRDMDVFCNAFRDGDVHMPHYNENVQISMAMAPVLDEQQPQKYSPSFEDFFSLTTQKKLLAPLRTLLRGFKAVKIGGHVDRNLAIDVQNDMKQDRWSDPAHVLANFVAEKERGSRLFKQGNKEEGCLIWQDAALDIDKMVESSSWSTLTKCGGEPFVSQLAELYFLVRLNILHGQITNIQKGTMPAKFAGIMGEDSLNLAVLSLKKGHWMEGYKYRPTLQHLAKLRYRFALLLRLQGEPGTAARALTYIDGALLSQPGDPAILKERDNIIAWMQYEP
jgi:hypothetical protein